MVEPRRSRADSLKLLAMVCVPLMLGVWIRVRVPNFLAADLSFEADDFAGAADGAGCCDGWSGGAGGACGAAP